MIRVNPRLLGLMALTFAGLVSPANPFTHATKAVNSAIPSIAKNLLLVRSHIDAMSKSRFFTSFRMTYWRGLPLSFPRLSTFGHSDI